MLVRGDTSLAELHHVFQVAMGWENWHLHSFKRWGKEHGILYAGGLYFADDARRVHLGDFPWRVNDRFTYIYDFGDYWQHQVRVEKVLPPTALSAHSVCVSGRRACPRRKSAAPAATTSAPSTSSAGATKPSTGCWPARIFGRTRPSGIVPRTSQPTTLREQQSSHTAR